MCVALDTSEHIDTHGYTFPLPVPLSLTCMQGSSLSPLGRTSDPAKMLALLVRKWIVIHYSGLALLGTVVATAQVCTAARGSTDACTMHGHAAACVWFACVRVSGTTGI